MKWFTESPSKLQHWCTQCDAKIPVGDILFRVYFEGHVHATCCSMACARRALGIEAENALCGECRNTCVCREYGCTYHAKNTCANYEPEAEPEAGARFCPHCHAEIPGEGVILGARYCSIGCARKGEGIPEPEAEPFGHTNCPCLATEPEPEVWSFGVNLSTRNTSNGYIRGLHATMPNGKQRVVLVHDAGFDIDGNDIALLQAAPQTAAKLAKAEATNVETRAALRHALHLRATVVVERDALKAEIDANEDKAQAMCEALHAARAFVDLVEDETEYNNTGRLVINKIDAALGKDGV